MKEIIVVVNANEKINLDVQNFMTGLRGFVRENASEKINISLYSFSSSVHSFFEHVPISEVSFTKTIKPYGECKFFDSLGTILERVSDRINRLKGATAPEKVIFALITENFLDTSNDYSLDEVNTFLTYQREDYLWEFLVFGIGLKNDLEEVGFLKEDIYNTDITEEGMKKIFSIIKKSYEEV